MNSFWISLLVVFAGGAAIAVQAPLNAALARGVGDSAAAAMISFMVGFIALAVFVVLRGAVPGIAVLRAIQPWMFAGGLLGAFYVWSAVWSVQSLGVLTMIAAVVLGQLAAAIALDASGAFGLPVQEVSFQRLAAVALVFAGLVLSRY